MRGSIKIEVTEVNECGNFPITQKLTFEQDNTFESIDEWIDVFKQILFAKGFSEAGVKEVFNEE